MIDTTIVWWALVLGGLGGGLTRSFMDLRIELPYAWRDKVTGGIIISPGVVGNMLLGAVAAFLLNGATAATLEFQTAYDSNGFWGPFSSSLVAGIGSAQILQTRAKQVIANLEETLLSEAEKSIEE